MAAIFEERTANREPSGQFGVDVATSRRTFVLHAPLADGSAQAVTSQELYDRVRLINGGTNPGPVATRPLGSPGGAGTLDRLMPMCDPQFPGLFADAPTCRVVPMELYREDRYGLGALLAVPPLAGGAFPLYHGVEFDVTFQARPYAVLPNDRMYMMRNEFWDVDGVRKYLWHAPEHLRFVTTFVDDMDSRVSASVGSSMTYRAPSGVPAGADGSTFPGIPDMVVPDQKYILRWHQVPLRYLTSPNSFLVRYKGFINQWAFLGDRPPGSLLYMGAKAVKVYTPPQFLPAQQPTEIDGWLNVLQGSFHSLPLVDFELTFIYTSRAVRTSLDDVPAVERPNRNWIAAGHNLLPHWHSRKFFYGHAKTVPANDYANWVPYYLSFPLQVLFMDPDVPGIVFTP